MGIWMSSPGNPHHSTQAESFMKALKVEEVYLVSRRLGSDDPDGPVDRVHSITQRRSAKHAFEIDFFRAVVQLEALLDVVEVMQH
jgi:hypothetical protein